MGTEVRWGVLGNATIARKCVLPAIHASRTGRIRALGTRRPDEAREVAAQNRVEQVYDSYERVIADPDVDAVYIPLPNHLHKVWVIRALEGGKHVLCEKPISCNGREAREMAAAAEENGRFLMEALMYRFHPRSRRVKSLVQQGGIGTPHLLRAAFCFAMEPEQLLRPADFRLEAPGGGSLLDVGCYGVSTARWLFGSEPRAVQAQAVYHQGHGVDIQLVGNLRFDSGRLAVIEASFCAGLQQTYSITGSEGALELPHDAYIPWDRDGVVQHRRSNDDRGETITVPGADQYRLMVDHFNRSVVSGSPPELSVADSIANMDVLDALARAARSGETVEMSSR